MQTTIIVTIAVILILAFIAWFMFFRVGKSPSVAMFGVIESTLLQLQQNAFKNVVSPSTAANPSESAMQKMMDQTGTIHNMVRFIYSIETNDDGFLHVISSQLIAQKTEEFQVQCMLFVMLTLTRQLDEIGISEKDVSFDIDQSESGTHYLYMLLDSAQHKCLKNRLASS